MTTLAQLVERYRTAPTPPSLDAILDDFLFYLQESKITLYPAQEDAILALFESQNVILNTPTGSGKSLVAMAFHFKSIATQRKSVYTSPIKALVNEKFLNLCNEFGAENVGMITGDSTVNEHAPITCVTAEILSNAALRDGADCIYADVIMDEFHYYSDRERGVAWQIPLLTLPKAQFLLMSATLGNVEFFQTELTKLTGNFTKWVHSKDRPVPLEFEYSEVHLDKAVSQLAAKGRAPIYIVNFTQRETHEVAQSLLSLDFCTKEEKKIIAEALHEVDFSSPFGKEFPRLLKHGIGIHHAGLLPKYRVLVEKLAQKGLLKIICGTDTLGVGVNVPIKSVLFTKLCKYDGEKTTLLSVRDFHQISGRAGRKGFDDLGTVVIQAPEHVIENIRLEEKAAGDSGKLRKLVKRKPPEKGYIAWNKDTYLRLIGADPEPLVSRFQVTHGMLLNVLGRKDDGCVAMQILIRNSHETPDAKKRHRKIAFQLMRSLLEREIISFVDTPYGRRKLIQLNIDLQDDFSLNQTLALFAVDTAAILDSNDPEYALDILTLCESVAENPDVILRRQLDRLKTQKMAEMKSEGIEFDVRIETLDKMEYPKPKSDFIYMHFNAFAAKHPWIMAENIRPKSVAREMYESFYSFADYIREYDLERSEGLLLRYISEVYKVLLHTVPDGLKNDEVRLIEEYFRTMIREIDSSLLQEWERLRRLSSKPLSEEESAAFLKAANQKERDALAKETARAARDLIAAQTIQIRNAVFSFVRALQSHNLDAIVFLTDGTITRDVWEKWLKEFDQLRLRILTDSRARSNTLNEIKFNDDIWKIAQRVLDSSGEVLCEFHMEVAAKNLDNDGKPKLRFLSLPELIETET